MRKAIADNMVRSFYEAPHATLVSEVDVKNVIKFDPGKERRIPGQAWLQAHHHHFCRTSDVQSISRIPPHQLLS